MNRETISQLVDELRSNCLDHELIRVIPSGESEITLHLREADPPFIVVSCHPRLHRVLSVKRRLRDLEKAGSHTQFSIGINRDLSGGIIRSVEVSDEDRIVSIGFDIRNLDGSISERTMVAQMTGRSSNIFLLDGDRHVVLRERETSGPGQQVGDLYAPPERGTNGEGSEKTECFPREEGETFSDSVDRHYAKQIDSIEMEAAAGAERARIKSELKRADRLLQSLRSDLASHGDPEQWKRLGDLLLANTANARRVGDQIFVTDYFDPDSPEIVIAGDGNKGLTQIAEEYFKKYTKARNAAGQLSDRISAAEREVGRARARLEFLEQSLADGSFKPANGAPKRQTVETKGKSRPKAGTRSPFRRFRSSDGLEILVGKGSRDNDELTFKTAKSLDTWLHAADYPGSHVVIRTAGKKEIPQRSLIEAAKLAAFYSDAKDQPKVAVHHTQKKFVSKIKGGAPGLVRLSSFKTVMVEPEVPSGISRD